MIKRGVQSLIESKAKDKKAIILMGPRQVGKTTLLHEIFKTGEEVLHWNGDDAEVRDTLRNASAKLLKSLIGTAKILCIDEAQRIENIGLCIKMIVDQIPGVKVYATGSSSFELADKINEPMTGRKWEYQLFPLSFQEMVTNSNLWDEKKLLHHRLIYGYYPDVVNNPGNEREILAQLSDSYLYKDILTWERIHKPDRLEKLVQALAFQMGNMVSYNELGQLAGLNNETVEHYIHLLEKSFIVYRLGTFNRNLRDELKKSRKIYFYDNGLRNAIIKQFSPIGMRDDVGALWENFLMAERLKKIHYNRLYCNRFFWRNQAQQEIDYIEERDGQLHAYEFKWSDKKGKKKFPVKFTDAYNPAITEVIHQENYLEFILDPE